LITKKYGTAISISISISASKDATKDASKDATNPSFINYSTSKRLYIQKTLINFVVNIER
jgi:hypothetical protein